MKKKEEEPKIFCGKIDKQTVVRLDAISRNFILFLRKRE